jgi:hypothetical protein
MWGQVIGAEYKLRHALGIAFQSFQNFEQSSAEIIRQAADSINNVGFQSKTLNDDISAEYNYAKVDIVRSLGWWARPNQYQFDTFHYTKYADMLDANIESGPGDQLKVAPECSEETWGLDNNLDRNFFVNEFDSFPYWFFDDNSSDGRYG